VVLQLGGLGQRLKSPYRKIIANYEMLHRASELDGFFGTESGKSSDVFGFHKRRGIS
jgi:hypothetical protein